MTTPLHEQLRQYNRWRRGDEAMLGQADPRTLGLMLDAAADRLEYLEKLHADATRCYQMLLTETDTNLALAKAENILREALADIKKTRKT